MGVDVMNIKPCPFCGYSASIATDYDSNGNDCKLVECNGCEALGPASDCYLNYTGVEDVEKEEESAIKKWNNRK